MDASTLLRFPDPTTYEDCNGMNSPFHDASVPQLREVFDYLKATGFICEANTKYRFEHQQDLVDAYYGMVLGMYYNHTPPNVHQWYVAELNTVRNWDHEFRNRSNKFSPEVNRIFMMMHETLHKLFRETRQMQKRVSEEDEELLGELQEDIRKLAGLYSWNSNTYAQCVLDNYKLQIPDYPEHFEFPYFPMKLCNGQVKFYDNGVLKASSIEALAAYKGWQLEDCQPIFR